MQHDSYGPHRVSPVLISKLWQEKTREKGSEEGERAKEPYIFLRSTLKVQLLYPVVDVLVV